MQEMIFLKYVVVVRKCSNISLLLVSSGCITVHARDECMYRIVVYAISIISFISNPHWTDHNMLSLGTQAGKIFKHQLCHLRKNSDDFHGACLNFLKLKFRMSCSLHLTVMYVYVSLVRFYSAYFFIFSTVSWSVLLCFNYQCVPGIA